MTKEVTMMSQGSVMTSEVTVMIQKGTDVSQNDTVVS